MFKCATNFGIYLKGLRRFFINFRMWIIHLHFALIWLNCPKRQISRTQMKCLKKMFSNWLSTVKISFSIKYNWPKRKWPSINSLPYGVTWWICVHLRCKRVFRFARATNGRMVFCISIFNIRPPFDSNITHMHACWRWKHRMVYGHGYQSFDGKHVIVIKTSLRAID